MPRGPAPWYMGSCTDPMRGSAIPLSSNLAVVASTSMNFASSLKGEQMLFLASSRTSRAAAVFPTPGGPYNITCWGFGPQRAALRDFSPSACPIISSNLVGLVFSAKGSVSEMERMWLSFSSSFTDSLSTAPLLPCCALSRFQK